MRELNHNELVSVSGGYGANMLANIGEFAICAVGGAVVGAWTLAIWGDWGGASRYDLIGIGGGITGFLGALAGAAVGIVLGAIKGTAMGYERGLAYAEELMLNMIHGKPGNLRP
ncbi:Blp family class II bacteriocin [Mixta tenebrionis]|uniref:Colicin V synthesis protein n=1 Tax=Mixta tenebrionis TaxID=2562439 RepID=A0A506V4Y0_9GAMM|nr:MULTISPECIES: Blp family class II bacteriocin [Mixta]QHM77746.1 hypothetical protein C7M52_03749 [Mixta theicola]TPW40489.1 hypothetical protein FKM52_17780 [Mixta tenebrionis]